MTNSSESSTRTVKNVSLDAVDLFLKDIRGISLLTPEEVKEHAPKARAYLKAVASDKDSAVQLGEEKKSFDLMVRSNLRLVVTIAKRYRNQGVSFSDLIQEGNIGLIQAIKRFEVERGFAFSTFAFSWIKWPIKEAVKKYAEDIRVSADMQDEWNKYCRIGNALSQELGRQPTTKEIAIRAETDEASVMRVYEFVYNTKTISLDARVSSMYDEDGGTVADTIPDTTAKTPDCILEEREMFSMIEQLIDSLPDERLKDIFVRRTELSVYKKETLKSTGGRHGISRERVRQLHGDALHTMRQRVKRKGLQLEHILP